jgi:uncharacterized protein YfdQ (DUF2303 family)
MPSPVTPPPVDGPVHLSGTDNAVATAADLGRRDTERRPRSYDLDHTNALVVSRLHADERVEVTDLEGHLPAPLWPRGNATVHDPTHFADYVVRLNWPGHTTVWAQPDKGRVTAVFDDHADADTAGWRRHTAALVLQPDPDWQQWIARHDSLGGQARFAEHLEGLAHTVIDPDPATMLEIATTFDAKRSVNFRSGIRTDNGDVQLRYEETTKAAAGQAGQMEIPAAFTIAVSPYVGLEPVTVSARLRWRITEGELGIGYALLRPDRAVREAMTALVAQISERIAPLPVFLGTVPDIASARGF